MHRCVLLLKKNYDYWLNLPSLKLSAIRTFRASEYNFVTVNIVNKQPKTHKVYSNAFDSEELVPKLLRRHNSAYISENVALNYCWWRRLLCVFAKK